MSGALSSNPSGLSLLSPLGFKLFIKRLPNVDFFTQRVYIPGVSSNPIDTPNPILVIPQPGDHVEFETLQIEMIIDEQMAGYFEIGDWLRGVSKESFQQYATRASAQQMTDAGLVSDIVLTIMTSDRNPNIEINYVDAFPVSLSGLWVDSTLPDIEYIKANVSFKYTRWERTLVT